MIMPTSTQTEAEASRAQTRSVTDQSRVRFPIISPTLPDPALLAEDMRAIFSSGRLTCGEQVAGLESDVCERTGVGHAVAVSSGTSGLMLLLKALGLPKDSEVITPSFTFAATSHALLWNSLRPVFCDSEPGAFTLDVDAAESLIGDDTVALYPVCIFGVMGDLDAYQALAERHGLGLLYDSAQGLCSVYKGIHLGNFGDGEVFSLSPTKVVTGMEGGLVTTNNDCLADTIRHMRDYGKAPDGQDMQWQGLSARMPEVNALVARWSLANADTWIANREAVVSRYQARLSGTPGLSFQKTPDYCVSSHNYVVILLDPEECLADRDELFEHLKANGIQSKRYFYPALHNQTLYKGIQPGCAARLPVAERVSNESLALPMYSHMPLDWVDEICDRIIELVGSKSSI